MTSFSAATVSSQNMPKHLLQRPYRWVVTGVAGFIGSHILQELLAADQVVVGLDNFSTGHRQNLCEVQQNIPEKKWRNFTLVEGDIRNLDTCRTICKRADYVLHHAALGSVPRSLEDPLYTHAVNVDGFVNMLLASRDHSVKRFVYAASSSTYGDDPVLPKVETQVGNMLSPYAVSKYVNELYADVFSRAYDMPTIGLRYFNVFGERQDHKGAYAAVIPKWIAQITNGERITIHGDGETSRDFCYIENVVQALLLSALTESAGATNQIYNIASGTRTTLNELCQYIYKNLQTLDPSITIQAPLFGEFRAGDIRHSVADISKAQALFGYNPTISVQEGLARTAKWHMSRACSKVAV